MTKHVPVMLPEVMEHLAPQPGDTILDGTVGSGGYAQAITTSIGAKGCFVGIDADKTAIAATKEALRDYDGRVCLTEANFRTVSQVLTDCEVESLDGAVFDLGFRSEQLEMKRGFSFQEEAPLSMTFTHPDHLDETAVTAFDVVNKWDEESIANILDGYGNERYADRIAATIVERRQRDPIETTDELVRAIKKAVPRHYRHGRTHPATRTFQAIRIAVNDEIGALKEGLAGTFAALRPSARLVVVSFHSLEDRVVKEMFRRLTDEGVAEPVTDSPVTADRTEVGFNPRSRSAKLRAIEKVSS